MLEEIRIGIIQTSLNAENAWQTAAGVNWKDAVKISALEEQQAQREIRAHIKALQSADEKPHIILLPELSVPMGMDAELKQFSRDSEAIILAGMDYKITQELPYPEVKNEAIVIIPSKIAGHQISTKLSTKRVGKTYPAPAEDGKLSKIGVSFRSSSTVHLFSSDILGSFGVAVCYDFLDLDRIALYRDKIQHLFILAYNRDVNSFTNIAESISRMVFCNVIVCNCGTFGGSLAVSPFYTPWKRTVYKQTGPNLVSSQIISLPAADLKRHQEGKSKNPKAWKSLPPGFSKAAKVKAKSIKV